MNAESDLNLEILRTGFLSCSSWNSQLFGPHCSAAGTSVVKVCYICRVNIFFFVCVTDRNTSALRYCPSSDTWTIFRTCPVHIRKQQMLSVEDTIYLVGGYTHELETGWQQRRPSQTEDVLTVQSYNITTGEWLQLKENTSKSGLNLTCTLHNDGIYIMSRDVSLPTSLEHRVFLKYNIFSDAWEAFRRFPALGQNMLLCSLYLPNLL